MHNARQTVEFIVWYLEKKVFGLICSRTEFLIERTRKSPFRHFTKSVTISGPHKKMQANIPTYTDMYTNYINYKSLRQITIDCFDVFDDDESKMNPNFVLMHPIRFDFFSMVVHIKSEIKHSCPSLVVLICIKPIQDLIGKKEWKKQQQHCDQTQHTQYHRTVWWIIEEKSCFLPSNQQIVRIEILFFVDFNFYIRYHMYASLCSIDPFYYYCIVCVCLCTDVIQMEWRMHEMKKATIQ